MNSSPTPPTAADRGIISIKISTRSYGLDCAPSVFPNGFISYIVNHLNLN